MIVILKCAIFIHFKPNLIHWIASNTNLMKAPNTNFTKFVKNWFVQIKFFQILPKCHYYKSKYHQIHPGTPKYWDFGSFFSICEHQMSLLGQDVHVLQRSNYRAGGRVRSWLGEWTLTMKLSWQKLLQIIQFDTISQNGRQESQVLQRSNYRARGQVLFGIESPPQGSIFCPESKPNFQDFSLFLQSKILYFMTH